MHVARKSTILHILALFSTFLRLQLYNKCLTVHFFLNGFITFLGNIFLSITPVRNTLFEYILKYFKILMLTAIFLQQHNIFIMKWHYPLKSGLFGLTFDGLNDHRTRRVKYL